MRLRLSIPLDLYLIAASDEQLSPTLTFSHDGCTVNVGLGGDAALCLDGDAVPEDQRHFRQIRRIQIKVRDDQAGGCLATIISSDDRVQLVELLIAVGNRILRAIRNVGTVTNVKEIQSGGVSPDDFLVEWRIELSDDGEKWVPVVKEEGLPLGELLTRALVTETRVRRRTLSQPTAELHAGKWSEIEEAIQDNLQPSPFRSAADRYDGKSSGAEIR